MANRISKRLEEILQALPVREGMRILEIGCGTGVLAREIVRRTNNVFVLGIDRSKKAIDTSVELSRKEIAQGRLQFMQTAIEDFDFKREALFDFAVAIRVGALDGRHPELEKQALKNISKALKPGGKLFIDGGNPVREIRV